MRQKAPVLLLWYHIFIIIFYVEYGNCHFFGGKHIIYPLSDINGRYLVRTFYPVDVLLFVRTAAHHTSEHILSLIHLEKKLTARTCLIITRVSSLYIQDPDCSSSALDRCVKNLFCIFRCCDCNDFHILVDISFHIFGSFPKFSENRIQ